MLEKLFPEELKLQITHYRLEEDGELSLHSVSKRQIAACPACKQISQRRNGSYMRHPADLPCLGHQVRMHLSVKRFFCDNEQCRRVTFSEQFAGLVGFKKRRSERLRVQQLGIGMELGGEGGKRVLAITRMPISAATIIADIRKMPEVEHAIPRVLGIDDWAKRKGLTYGTILVDLETGNPVDLLDSRDAASVEGWLSGKDQIEIVSRDRSREYKKAITAALPNADQVADRFHLLKNLRDAAEKFIREKPACLQAASQVEQLPTIGKAVDSESADDTDCRSHGNGDSAENLSLPVKTEVAAPEPAIELAVRQRAVTKAEQAIAATHARRQARYELVWQKFDTGQSMSAIALELGMAFRTVKRYLSADGCPRFPRGISRATILAPYTDTLESRWQAGCTNATQLFSEIRDQHGYLGSRATVARWARQQRKLLPPKLRYLRKQAANVAPKIARIVKPAPLSARKVSWLLFHVPAKLNSEESLALQRILAIDEQASIAYQYIQQFRQMLTSRCTEKLDTWLTALIASGLTGLATFANGLLPDLPEVRNAFTMVWSNGMVEGHVNRLKTLKRQMYGRAKFDLLRKRVLYRPRDP